MECDKETVQVAAIAGLTTLGAVAIIIDGDVGNTIAIAIAGAIGFMIRFVFGNKGGETDAEEV